MSQLEVRPAAADFRLMSRRAVDELGRLREAHRYVRGMVQWLGFRVAEVPFEPAARQGGVSKYTLRRMVRFAMDGLLSFSPAPARLAVGAGLVVTGASWVLSVAAVALLVSLAEPVARVGLVLLTALHVLAACGLAAAGMLGEYATRIYDQSKGRPVYVVKESTTDPARSGATAAGGVANSGWLERGANRMAAPVIGELPQPWRALQVFGVGGLFQVGYASNSDLLLVLSAQGRGVFDCLAGEKLARDYAEAHDFFDPVRLTSLGIGPLSETTVRMAGLFGGGLPLTTSDGWRLEVRPAVGRLTAFTCRPRVRGNRFASEIAGLVECERVGFRRRADPS